MLLALGVVLVDAVTKLLGRGAFPQGGIAVVPGMVLRVVDNPRGPFGLGPLWLTIVASLTVLVIVIRHRYLLPAAYSLLPRVGLGLLLGGGLANLGERLLFGRTTDLLVLGNLTALNVADLAILAGLGAFLLPELRGAGAMAVRE